MVWDEGYPAPSHSPHVVLVKTGPSGQFLSKSSVLPVALGCISRGVRMAWGYHISLPTSTTSPRSA
jgi:hypothetical protein